MADSNRGLDRMLGFCTVHNLGLLNVTKNSVRAGI